MQTHQVPKYRINIVQVSTVLCQVKSYIVLVPWLPSFGDNDALLDDVTEVIDECHGWLFDVSDVVWGKIGGPWCAVRFDVVSTS